MNKCVFLAGCTVILFFCCTNITFAQNDTGQDATVSVTVSGRLAYEDGDSEKNILLNGRDGQTYCITGDLKDQAAGIILELKQDNLVEVEGNREAKPYIKCLTKQQYGTDNKLQIFNECLRIYNLDVKQILKQEQSTEIMPAPTRDKAMEDKQLQLFEQQNIGIAETIAQLRGTISNMNMRSPIKTIEVAYRDKDSLPLKRTLLITTGTGISRYNAQSPQQPLGLSVEGLKIGQKVSVIYSFDSNTGENRAVGIMVLPKE